MKKFFMMAVFTAMFFCGFSQNGNGGYNDSSVIIKNGKLGFVDKNGNVSTPIEYTSTLIYTISVGYECGATRLSTETMALEIPSSFNGSYSALLESHRFFDISAYSIPGWVEKNGKWGFVNRNGKMILPFKYVLITGTGVWNDLPQFKMTSKDDTCESSLIVHQENGKWGVVDFYGDVIPCKYDEIKPVKTTYGEINHFLVKQNGKWGAMFVDEYNNEGPIWANVICKQILPCKYDEIKPVEYNEYSYGPFANYFKVKLNGKWGVFVKQEQTDKNGESKETWKQILPCKYDTNEIVYDGYFYFMHKLNGKWGVVNPEGKQILPCNYDSNEIVYEHVYFLHKLNGKWGVVNSEGKQILPCKYDEITAITEIYDYYGEKLSYVFVKLNGKWGVINSDGNQILPCKYDTSEIVYKNGHFLHKVNGKWGVVNSKGKQILPCKYDEIKPVEYKYGNSLDFANSFKVKQNGKWGVFVKQEQTDKNGESKETWKQILPCEYDTNEIVYEHGYFLHKLNGKWGVVNSEGKQILPCKYDEIKPVEYKYGNSLDFANSFKVKQNGKWGVVNSEGKQILPCKYEKSEIKCEKFYDQLLLQAKDKFGIMNSEGELLLPCEYDEITAITEIDDYYYGEKLSCVFVKLNGKWGIMNSEGELLLPCEYDSISEFEGFLRIKKSSHYGLLTSEFKTYLPCEYQQITALDKGYLMLVKNGKYGIMTDNGKTVLKCEFDSISTTNDNILMKQNGKWGAINAKGAIPCKYTEIVPVRNFYAVKDGKKWGIVGAAGNTILAPTYKLDKVEAFGNFFKVSYKKHFGLLDGTGKLVLPIAYEEITKRDGSSFFVKQKGKWGVADSKGKITVPCSHESTAGISR